MAQTSQASSPSGLFTPEVFGPYVLISHLGRGGMADVYKARMEGVAGFARYLVVKRILKVHTAEPHFVEMFINEAKIAARLSHPNIVHVYDLGEVEGELFMAMEYVRGQDLLRILRASAKKQSGPPPPPMAAYILREACRGLAHAHEHVDEHNAPRPIIHRDISPQNIMVGYDAQVKLVDFGIAKAVTAYQEATKTDSLKGKFGYMAPEQIDTGLCTPQTDLFSAGVVLHELLTGKRLFRGNTDYDTMVKVKTAPLLPPSAQNPKVDPELDRIALMALERDPAQRYQKAAQLARDLDAYLQQARFAVDDAVAWLRQVVPPEEREENESQLLHALPKGTTPGRGATPSATARALPDKKYQPHSLDLPALAVPRSGGSHSADSHLAGHLLPGAPSAGRRRRPLLLGLLVLVLLAASGGSAAWILRSRPGRPEPANPANPGNPRGLPQRASGSAGSGVPAAGPRPGAGILVDSEPSGATVYAGPRLLGQTPVRIELAGELLEVTLSLAGRPDLPYTLRKSDGERVVLRLPAEQKNGPRHEHRSRHDRHGGQPGPGPEPAPQITAPASPGPGGPPSAPERKLKVRPLDDIDDERPARPVRPPVRPIDD